MTYWPSTNMANCPSCGLAYYPGIGHVCLGNGISPIPPWPSLPPKPSSDRGWQCPVCRKVHAPFIMGCDCHKGEAKLETMERVA